ncbi:MAG: SIS domain-containing protein [Candidatus Blackburnbacteria bacterium]|nr:SIS domain-containing protein [Candidatus Blackburnbacteria bacterium]
MKQTIYAIIGESITIKKVMQYQLDDIDSMVKIITKALGRGNKLLLFGNGGSAADAQHIAGEFIGRYAAIALTTNTSTITAIGNDYGFDHIFERQIESLCRKGDIAIGISTSGMSKNVILGLIAAKSKGAKCIALTGNRAGKMSNVADLTVKVPTTSTPRIQECHIMIGHIVYELVGQVMKR